MTNLTRRHALGTLGAVGGAGALSLLGGGRPASAASASSKASPGEEGPYWVEVKLNRSDIRSDADGTDTQSGVTLTCTLQFDYLSAGTPFTGATVDVWHCNAQGLYSDEQSESTTTHDWLRGSQVTDSTGSVTFTTIYPGWYSGRTIHIHYRVRTFSGSSTSFDFEGQLMFDDSVSDTVMATSAYSRSQSRDTRNSGDHVYSNETSEYGASLLSLSGNTTDGYVGTYSAVITGPTSGGSSGGSDYAASSQGTYASGTTTATHGTTSTPTSGGTTTGTTGTSSAGGTSVATSLGKTRWSKTTSGLRQLTASLSTGETTRVVARLTRGQKVLSHGSALLHTGARSMKLRLSSGTSSGRATLTLTLTDLSGNTRIARRIVTVPKA